jgi:hypothetical protein
MKEFPLPAKWLSEHPHLRRILPPEQIVATREHIERDLRLNGAWWNHTNPEMGSLVVARARELGGRPDEAVLPYLCTRHLLSHFPEKPPGARTISGEGGNGLL